MVITVNYKLSIEYGYMSDLIGGRKKRNYIILKGLLILLLQLHVLLYNKKRSAKIIQSEI